MTATNDQILLAIGRLEGQMGAVQGDLKMAADSRKSLYERAEENTHKIEDVSTELSRRIEKLVTTNEITAGTVAQLRDAVKLLADNQQQMADAVRPILDLKSELPGMVESWKDVRKTGQRIVFLLTIGGVTFTGAMVAFWSFFTDIVRHWLGVTPPGA